MAAEHQHGLHVTRDASGVREQDTFVARGRLTMHTHCIRVAWIRVAWIASVALVAAGTVLVALFPQPFITYWCSNTICPTEVSGGFSGGYVVIVLGLVVAVIAGIMSLVSVADRGHKHQS
jgi:hypothetical protein